MVEFGVRSVRGDTQQVLLRFPQRSLESTEAADSIVKHHSLHGSLRNEWSYFETSKATRLRRGRETYHPLVVVLPKEIEQGVHALLVMEQLRGKVPIEELHPVADRLRQRRTRERSIERLEVQLEHEVVLSAEHKIRCDI